MATVLAAPASPARAEVRVESGAWAVATMEVATVTFVALRFGVEVIPDGAPALGANLAPVVLGAGAFLAAHRWQPDARPAYAAHGAVWGGTALFLLGAAIEGRHERSGLDAGGATFAFAAGGAVAGGVLGIVGGPSAPKTWLLAPTVGLGVGTIAGMGAVLVSGDIGGDRTARRIAVGIGAGVAAGLIGGALVARAQGRTGHERSALLPSVEPARDRVVVTLAGTF